MPHTCTARAPGPGSAPPRSPAARAVAPAASVAAAAEPAAAPPASARVAASAQARPMGPGGGRERVKRGARRQQRPMERGGGAGPMQRPLAATRGRAAWREGSGGGTAQWRKWGGAGLHPLPGCSLGPCLFPKQVPGNLPAAPALGTEPGSHLIPGPFSPPTPHHHPGALPPTSPNHPHPLSLGCLCEVSISASLVADLTDATLSSRPRAGR